MSPAVSRALVCTVTGLTLSYLPVRAQYSARGGGFRVAMLDEGVALVIRHADGAASRLTLRFGEDRTTTPTAERLLAGRANYFVGRDLIYDTMVDAAGHTFVAGQTDSTDFPVARPQQAALRGGGNHTIRIQTREDGLSIDQIVLSPVNFRDIAPGALKNDTTIIGR